jgi:hypothetical protein
MTKGNKGMGMHKHGTSGRAGKSPKFRHQQRIEAERNIRSDKSRIKDPKVSIKELFNR